MKKRVKTNKDGLITKITLGNPGKRNKTRCIRCGVKKNTEQYYSCMHEYCDSDTLINDFLF